MAYIPYAQTFGDRYEIIGPNGAVAVLNDPGDLNYVGMLSEITGLDSPDVRESADDLTEADGGVHGSFYFGRRPITMNVRVFGHASVAERVARLDKLRRATMAMRSDATLKWKPTTRQENVVLNPSFEIDTSNWTITSSGGFAVATAFDRINGWASVGTWSGRLQATNANDATARTMQVREGGAGVTAHPVVPGRSYTGRAMVDHGAAPALGSRLQINWYKSNGGGANPSSSVGTLVGAGGTGTYEALLTATAPSDAYFAALSLQTRTDEPNDVLSSRWDAVYFGETANYIGYFDGDQAGYNWQGPPHASASGDYIEMWVPVRRQQPLRETGAWVKDVQCALVSEFAVLMSLAQYSTALTGSGVAASAENHGSYESYPIVEFTGVSSNPTMNDGHGNIFRTGPSGFTLSLAAGETVQFDMLNHSGVFTAGARAGQSANRYINFATTQWPYLRPGTVESFTGAGGGTWRILWRDTWV